MYTRIRKTGSRIKRRLLTQDAGSIFTVAYSKPAISQQALQQHNGSFRAAVIGAGNQGRDLSLGISQIAGVELVAVADRSQEALGQFKECLKRPDLRSYTDAKKMLETEDIDLICIATNTPSHIPLGCMALEAGVQYLLVEKPIGTNPVAARNFVQDCAEKGATLAINHTRRWLLDYQAIKRYIVNGQIGSVRQVYAAIGSGGLSMNGVHFVDLMRYFTESEISWVIGNLDSVIEPNKRGAEYFDPGGYALLHFDNGARGFIDLSNDLLRKDNFIVVKTTQGRIEIDERAKRWTVIGAESPFTVPFAEASSLPGKSARVIADLLSGNQPASTGDDGVAALEAVIAMHISQQNDHCPTSLPLSVEHQMLEFTFP